MSDAAKSGKFTFTQLSRAWYAPSSLPLLDKGELDEFMIGTHEENDEHDGEFSIVFVDLGRENNYARVKVFDENLRLFDEMTDLKEFIKSGRCTAPEALREFLVGAGYLDITNENCPSELIAHRKSALSKLSDVEIDALGLDVDKLVPEGFRDRAV